MKLPAQLRLEALSHSLLFVYKYEAQTGALTLDGRHVALAEVDATGRELPALAQADLQRQLMRGVFAVAADVPLEQFVAENLTNKTKRFERVQQLIDDAEPISIATEPVEDDELFV